MSKLKNKKDDKLLNLNENNMNYEKFEQKLKEQNNKLLILFFVLLSFIFFIHEYRFQLINKKIENIKEENNKKIENLKEENYKRIYETENLWRKIGEIENLLKKIVNITNISFQLLFDSHIIKSKDEANFIFDYIRENDKSFNFNMINLLYRGSRYGDITKTCHELCDNKQNILIVIISDNGFIFGGYSKIGFKTTNELESKIDNNSFLFSIDLKKIYPAIKGKEVLAYYNDSNGLFFFNGLYFFDNFMNLNNFYISSFIKDHFNGLKDDYEMNGGEKKFKIKELEVFQLI